MRLINDWKQSWRYYSQVCSAATISISLIAVADHGGALLAIWRGYFEPQTYATLTALAGTLGYIGRLLAQNKAGDEK